MCVSEKEIFELSLQEFEGLVEEMIEIGFLASIGDGRHCITPLGEDFLANPEIYDLVECENSLKTNYIH